MIAKIRTADRDGNPAKVGGVNSLYNVENTGKTFTIETNGEGEGETGIPDDLVPFPHTARIHSWHPGYTIKTEYRQNVMGGVLEVTLTLVPFKRGGSVIVTPVAWPIHRDGLVLRDSNDAIFRWLGLDGFRFYIMWLRGQKAELESLVRGYLAVCPGVTMFRVFGMLDSFDHIYPQEWPNYYDELRPFSEWMRVTFGVGVEFVIFADAGIVMPDRGERDRHRQRVQDRLFATSNVLIEVANEPNANSNMPGGDQEAHEHAVAIQRANGLLVASGCSNEDAIAAGYAQGDYVTIHPPRDDQWYRKLKDVLDVRQQTGCPTVADEPIGIAEVDKPGSRTTNADECATAGANAQLHGLGSTIHGDFGINAAPFGPVQAKAAKAWHDAALWVPVEAQLARFTRGSAASPCAWTYAPGDAPSPAQHSDDIDLRSYAKSVGDVTYLVQCHVPQHDYRAAVAPCTGWRIDQVGPSVGLATLRQE